MIIKLFLQYKFTDSFPPDSEDYSIDDDLNPVQDSVTAAQGFSTDMRMYKYQDFRCLKPKKGIPSEKWPHYEMQAYRTALTKKDLKKVKEIPFDKYFFNFEDPEVWSDMTNSKKGLKIWKKTYGFDYAAFTPALNDFSDDIACQKHCLREEFGQFAKQCRKTGGFFKCCVLKLRIEKYESIRYGLKKYGLIDNGPSKDEMKCEKKWGEGNCYICLATHVCAKRVWHLFL